MLHRLRPIHSLCAELRCSLVVVMSCSESTPSSDFQCGVRRERERDVLDLDRWTGGFGMTDSPRRVREWKRNRGKKNHTGGHTPKRKNTGCKGWRWLPHRSQRPSRSSRGGGGATADGIGEGAGTALKGHAPIHTLGTSRGGGPGGGAPQ